MRWRSLHPAFRVVVVLVAAVVVVNVALALLDSFTSEADRARRASDPSSTQPDGTSAWAELLRRNGVPVETSVSVGSSLDPAHTMVLLDERVEEPDVAALADFVERGGHLVAGSEVATFVLATTTGDIPAWASSPGGDLAPVAAVPETDGISELVGVDGGAWADDDTLEPIVADDAGNVAVAVADIGSGRLVALADESLVQNRNLGDADNAAFSINLADGRPVSFVTPGSTEPTGLAAIPRRWWIALVGGVVAFLLGAIAVGRRIGPPDAPTDRAHPPRHTYAESIGLTLERAGNPDEALAPLRRHLRDGLARRGGLPVGADDDDVRVVALRLGWPEPEIDAVLTPVAPATMLTLGDALARLTTSDDPRHTSAPTPSREPERSGRPGPAGRKGTRT